MSTIPTATLKRLAVNVPRFHEILAEAREREANEADTVTIVADMLDEVFGYDKYAEITRGLEILGTFCDLAIKSGDQVQCLIEVKPIGVSLKDSQMLQALNFATRESIRLVVLTNAVDWQVHGINIENEIQHEHLYSFNVLAVNPIRTDDQELLFRLCKESMQGDSVD